MSTSGSSATEAPVGLGARAGLGLLFATLLAVGLNEAVGRSQFAGYDQSPFIDLAWRLANGQRPGVDFVSTLPLGFVGAVRAALLGWPPGMALLTHAGEVVFAVAVGAVAAAVGGLPRRRALRTAGVAWAVLAAPLLATNHLWHSVQAQQLAVAFVALVAVERSGAVVRVVTVVVAALLLLSKPNLGLPLWLALGGIRLGTAAGEARRGVVVALLTELAAAIALGAALAAWLGLDLAAVRSAWVGGSERAVPNPVVLLGLLLLYPVNTSLLGLCGLISAAVFVVARRALPEAPRAVGVVAVVTGVAWLPFLTDVDTKINAAPLFVMAASLAAELLPTSSARRDAGRGVVGLALALLLLGAVFGVGRLRARGVAESVLGDYHEVPADHRVSHGPLAGWWVGRTLADTLGELDRLKSEVPPGAPLFFGPKIEFAYAHVGAPPTPGLPLWWHRGTSYARDDEPLLIERFRAVGFCRLVFRAGDRMRFPEPLRADLETSWIRVDGYQRLDVFRPADGRCADATGR